MSKYRDVKTKNSENVFRTVILLAGIASVGVICPAQAEPTPPKYLIGMNPGDWSVDRSAPYTFENGPFGGRLSVLRLGVDPNSQPSSSFYQWQGYQQRTSVPAGNSFIGGDMWIGQDWQSGDDADYIRTGMWGSAMPEAAVEGGTYVDSQSVFPIIQFTNQDGTGRLEVWDTTASAGWVDLPDTASLINYGGWNSLSMRLVESDNKIEYYLNNELVYTWTAPAADDGSLPEQFWAVYLKARNNGVTSFDTYWSRLLSGLIIADHGTIGDTPGDIATTPGSAISVTDGAVIGGSVAGQGSVAAPAIISFAGSATIGSDVIGQNASINFSTAENTTTTIAGNVELEGASVTSGGTVAAPIIVDGSVAVGDGSILGGNWAIAGDVVNAGTIRPGNSIGTVSIGGNVTLMPDSVLSVEVDKAGNVDLVEIGGVAELAGGVDVSAIDDFQINHRYTILTAGGGFDSTQFDDSRVRWDNERIYAFVTPSLSYEAETVYLSIDRNNVAFASTAKTPNQAAAATAVDALTFGNSLYDATVRLTAPSASAAFEQLSGELYATAKTALIEDSGFVRQATGRQLRSSLGSDATSVWSQGYGSWASYANKEDRTAGFERNAGGAFIGADAPVSDNFRVGLVGGYGHSSFGLNNQSSNGSVDTYSLGLYGGGKWDQLGVRIGLDHAWHKLSTYRSVAFPGFSERLDSDYNARTTQVYGDVGYEIDFGGVAIEPFAGLAYVSLDTDGYSENGGNAALSGADGTTSATLATLGLRAATTFNVGEIAVTANGMLGWRHSLDHVKPTTTHAFSGSAPFTVTGRSLARDVAIVEAGLSADVHTNLSLGISYSGQFGSIEESGLRGQLNWKF